MERHVEMKYTVLLKSLAKKMGYQVIWSPPQIVSGGINPPPSIRYPGVKCYMALVRVGPKEYSGFGPTAVAARNFAASQAYLDVCFQLQEEGGRERQSVGVGDHLYDNGDLPQANSGNARDDAVGESQTSVDETTALSNEEEPPAVTGDNDQLLKRFAHDCHVYFDSVDDINHRCKNVSSSASADVQCSNETTNISSSVGSLVDEMLVQSENVVQGCGQRVEETCFNTTPRTVPSVDSSRGSVVTAVRNVGRTPSTSANPIGQLQELLMQANLPLPKYSISQQTQNGVTVFHCVGTANDFTGHGNVLNFQFQV